MRIFIHCSHRLLQLLNATVAAVPLTSVPILWNESWFKSQVTRTHFAPWQSDSLVTQNCFLFISIISFGEHRTVLSKSIITIYANWRALRQKNIARNKKGKEKTVVKIEKNMRKCLVWSAFRRRYTVLAHRTWILSVASRTQSKQPRTNVLQGTVWCFVSVPIGKSNGRKRR